MRLNVVTLPPTVLSLLGDSAVLLASAVLPELRRSQPLRFLAMFAAADAVAALIRLQDLWNDPGLSGALCTAQAALTWCVVWAAWLWTMAFAASVHAGFTRLRMELPERICHFCCWGVPLVVSLVITPTGSFSRWPNAPNSICTFGPGAPQWLDFLAHAVFLVAVAFNIYVLASVVAAVRRSYQLATGSGLLAPDDEASMRSRLQLWPRFLPYIAAMLLTQAPLTIVIVLRKLGVGITFYPTEAVCLALSMAHGLANGMLHAWYHGETYLSHVTSRRRGGAGGSRWRSSFLASATRESAESELSEPT